MAIAVSQARFIEGMLAERRLARSIPHRNADFEIFYRWMPREDSNLN